MRQLLLLLLPTLTLAKIQVDLTGTVHSGEVTSNAHPRGFEEHAITERERALFGIQNEDMKQAIMKINGKIPYEVYFTGSTPFGNLHKRYGWKEVHTKIQTLKNNFYVDFTSDTVRLSKTKYENNLSHAKDFFINENGYLVNMIHSYWRNAIQIEGITVTVRFNFNIEDNSSYFQKTFTFGGNRLYREKRYYETNATVRLQPGEKVTAELEALKGTIKVEIPYAVSLSGDVVAKYNEMYNDKYFYKFDINDILKANNIITTRQMHQWLLYEVLYDTQLRIRNPQDTVLRSFPTEGKVKTKGQNKTTIELDKKAEGVKMTRKKLQFGEPVDLDVGEIFDEDYDEESEETTEEDTQQENKET